ncbi:hypothetical protein ACJMK2_023938 [Sinanodonta woodiana]|uniref:Uncharacterized protein n=1 Tax=Sinanodonta woodiana TaxID=1069815 RepID=A0ABD3T5U5_SINWO
MAVNCSGRNVLPLEHNSSDFEINTENLHNEFLVGEGRVGEERHIVFATKFLKKIVTGRGSG